MTLFVNSIISGFISIFYFSDYFLIIGRIFLVLCMPGNFLMGWQGHCEFYVWGTRFRYIPLNSACFRFSIQLSFLESSGSSEPCFYALVGQVQKSLYFRANLALLPRQYLFDALHILWLVRTQTIPNLAWVSAYYFSVEFSLVSGGFSLCTWRSVLNQTQEYNTCLSLEFSGQLLLSYTVPHKW